MNTVQLIGRLTRDAELRSTGSGVSVATFTLAVNRNFKNAQGEYEADFINCQMWRKSAENFVNFTHKGAQVGITGRIQTRNYENAEGKRVFVTEVNADGFTLLEPRQQNQSQQNNQQQNQSQGFKDPFQSQNQQISNDDLPF